MGIVVASAMNSSISRTWVQEASLLSRTPSAADIERPEAQMPSNPASSTIFPDSPLCASMMKERAGACSRPRRRAALDVDAACASALPMGRLVAMGYRRFAARSSDSLVNHDDIKA